MSLLRKTTIWIVVIAVVALAGWYLLKYTPSQGSSPTTQPVSTEYGQWFFLAEFLIVFAAVVFVIAYGINYLKGLRLGGSSSASSASSAGTQPPVATAPEPAPTRQSGKELKVTFWGVVAIAMILFGIYQIIKLVLNPTASSPAPQCSTPADIGKTTRPAGPLPLPAPSKRIDITINSDTWTRLPQQTGKGMFHAEMPHASVKYEMMYVNISPEGVETVIGTKTCGGNARDYVEHPPCDRYYIRSINFKEAVIQWWED